MSRLKATKSVANLTKWPISTRIVPILFLVFVVMLFFNRLALTNLILARGDTFLYFYPYWQQASDTLREGRIPLWNPDLFMGAPFLANSQVGFFYPLNWMLWLLLPSPYAVSVSILIHISIATAGTYLAGRKCLSLSVGAALIAGLLFGLGGYVTAQIEHVNQLQGLAWLPWFFLAICTWKLGRDDWRSTVKLTIALALLFSLQLLAGHTQTTFITIFGLSIWLFASIIFPDEDYHGTGGSHQPRTDDLLSRLFYSYLPLIAGGFLALLLSAIQIVPTLELSQFSSRQGGLPTNEALSFSLNPLVLTRALLPTFNQALFSEYVAVLPLTALILATVGGLSWRRRTGVIPLVLVALLGLFFALGLFNPLYHLLVRLPGFNLFRVPARWMVLYALSVALLAGVGWDIVVGNRRTTAGQGIGHNWGRAAGFGFVLILLVMVWGVIALPLSRFVPVGAETTVEVPPTIAWLFWLLELMVLSLLITIVRKRSGKNSLFPTLLSILMIIVLFMATRSAAYNNPTTPEAYFDHRPTSNRLQSRNECEEASESCQTPAGRFLSLSDIFFDVGDQAEIDTIYQDQLSESARYDYTVAIKQKEILGPNLSMRYGLSAVDGFDGGLLPLKAYTELTSLILPEEAQTTDGRLREYLDSIPADRWLDLFNARYIITDKVGDMWQEGVFFDRQQNIELTSDDPPIAIGYIPQYEATELWLMAQGQPGYVGIQVDEELDWQLDVEKLNQDLYKVSFPEPVIPEMITLHSCPAPGDESPSCQNEWQLTGLALVDSRDETFQPLVPGNYRLIHSGDVKIYENLDVLSRAFIVKEWITVPTYEKSLEIMRSPQFEPGQMAVVLDSEFAGRIGEGGGQARITEYEPERMTVLTDTNSESLLVLTDAFYPGWEAKIDGDPVRIYQTDILFRGVLVPPGEHEVELTYKPITFQVGLVISVLGMFLVLSLMALVLVASRVHK